ncbi:hypothetical protein J2S25_001642 [Mesobacillus stamsii]|uniref:Uncharacterized protein n=1 Tax=Mesobacillus stamsii TaxID=225347 RepID=A0ABU0FVP3_9BACI|nr:hypothetical protein [Mesobacillus stamsii]
MSGSLAIERYPYVGKSILIRAPFRTKDTLMQANLSA